MFDGPYFPKSLDEELFDSWLEQGRLSKIGYNYLLIIWNEIETAYQPVYVETRGALDDYKDKMFSVGESLVAAYDLYSQARII